MEKKHKDTLVGVRSHAYSVGHYYYKLRDRVENAIENGEKMDRELYLELLEDVSRLSSSVGLLHFAIRQTFIDDNPEMFEGKDRFNIY
jgi:hypothetical protein